MQSFTSLHTLSIVLRLISMLVPSLHGESADSLINYTHYLANHAFVYDDCLLRLWPKLQSVSYTSPLKSEPSCHNYPPVDTHLQSEAAESREKGGGIGLIVL